MKTEEWTPLDIGGKDIRKDFIARCHVEISGGGFLIFPMATKKNNWKVTPLLSQDAMFDWFISKLSQERQRGRDEVKDRVSEIIRRVAKDGGMSLGMVIHIEEYLDSLTESEKENNDK